jgi:hypothetical protein
VIGPGTVVRLTVLLLLLWALVVAAVETLGWPLGGSAVVAALVWVWWEVW